MEPDQFKLVFNAVCFGASVTAAFISGLFCLLVTKDAWEEKKEEKERELSANRDGDNLIDPTDSKL
ncbi:hypothetical protein [Rothia sp. P3C3.S176]|uniref:hypothetical protein n=1 Tax=Rothia sp. P3C3.S176 TaxID=2962204 RepID=UPI0020C8907E|nr:hypothetical protein [Rothia sp. P3C3.S176]MCP8995044.1 hypothetical protein [Rothia sp. P3C3.S176]